MSTIKVTNVQHASAASAAITLDANGQATLNGLAYPTAGSLSNRNLIINGAMQVAQRGTSFSLAHDGTVSAYTTDRFVVAMSGADQWDCTVTQSSAAPDGYANSLLVTTGTAETTVEADEYMSVQYKVEAQDLQQIASGTAAAKAMTLSFWVRSSQTGTFAFAIYKGDNTARGISATYTISSANTWEYKIIAIPGDTGGGGIDDDNGNGWNLYWILAAGSNYTSTNSTSWINYVTAGLAYGHAQNGVITTANATWQITGVQLEVGSVATPFERRSYGQELSLCQRYFCKNGQWAVCQAQSAIDNITKGNSVNFPVTMRDTPGTITLYDIDGTSGQIHYQVRGGGGSNIAGSIVNSSSSEFNVRKSASANEEATMIFRYEASAEL